MQIDKAKSFPAATVPAAAKKLVHRRRETRMTRSEESKDARRARASKKKCRRSRSQGVLGVLHPTRRKNESKNLCRKHLELSERRNTFAPRKRRGKQAENKTARMKHKAARTRSQLDELTFDTFSVRTGAVNGANVIGHIDTLLRPCTEKGCDTVGPHDETKRAGTYEIVAS